MNDSFVVYQRRVKRIIFTSSTSAIMYKSSEPLILTEEDWGGLQGVEEVKRLGRASPAIAKYRASKTLAERGKPIFIIS
jgi:nucleoside-diphosphate-sugar epimerase